MRIIIDLQHSGRDFNMLKVKAPHFQHKGKFSTLHTTLLLQLLTFWIKTLETLQNELNASHATIS